MVIIIKIQDHSSLCSNISKKKDEISRSVNTLKLDETKDIAVLGF